MQVILSELLAIFIKEVNKYIYLVQRKSVKINQKKILNISSELHLYQ